MSRRLRACAAAFAASALLLAAAAPATAYQDQGLAATQADTPVIFDALILRPLGILMTAGGFVAFVPTAAVVSLTRPTDVVKPFKLLVVNPFRYTFMDPLGQHPDHSAS